MDNKSIYTNMKTYEERGLCDHEYVSLDSEAVYSVMRGFIATVDTARCWKCGEIKDTISEY